MLLRSSSIYTRTCSSSTCLPRLSAFQPLRSFVAAASSSSIHSSVAHPCTSNCLNRAQTAPSSASIVQVKKSFFAATYSSSSSRPPMSAAASSAASPVTPSVKRGVFILLEGLDRSGKSSQCVKLAERLNTDAPGSAVQMRFPDRETAIGKMIDAYLKQSAEIDDHAIHLLFSANRWEKHASMLSALQSGKHLIVDRYAYSGIAFTSSKVNVPGLTLDWTTAPDRGLVAPDLVIFLDITSEDAAKRGSYGEERYEKKEIQDRVREVFKKLRLQAAGQQNENADAVAATKSSDALPSSSSSSSSGASFGASVEWRVVNAGQTQEQVHEEITALAKEAIVRAANEPIKFL